MNEPDDLAAERPAFGDLAEGTLRQWLRAHADEVDAVVFDVDGVLMVHGHPVEGSPDLVEFVRERRIPFTLLTNDGCHSPEEKNALLTKAGLDFRPEDLCSCSHGLAEIAEQKGWLGRTVFVMGYLGNPCYAQEAGLNPIDDIHRMDECAALVVGEYWFDWERVLNAAFNCLIRNPHLELVVPNPDAYFPGHGRLHIGSGALGRFLHDLCERYGRTLEPIFLGKPFEPIFLSNHHRLERRTGRTIARDRVVMVGDSLASDICGARNFGYRTALVLTGITTADMPVPDTGEPEMVFHSP